MRSGEGGGVGGGGGGGADGGGGAAGETPRRQEEVVGDGEGSREDREEKEDFDTLTDSIGGFG